MEEYRNTDEEVFETAEVSLRYVMDGDPIDAPYNLLGLNVFAVINTLRENDVLFYGGSLSLEQRVRLEEVVAEVDHAVAYGLHYYPFGHSESRKQELSSADRSRLANNRVNTSIGKRSVSDKRVERINAAERVRLDERIKEEFVE